MFLRKLILLTASDLLLARRVVVSRRLAMMANKHFLDLPIIDPDLFKRFERKLTKDNDLTKICQSLRSMKNVRISEDPELEAWFTTDGQNFLPSDALCPDVLFVRSFYEKMFQVIRTVRFVVLIGNSGNSKSM